MKPAKIELLIKVIAWRMFSMCYGFSIAYLFTGDAGESAGIVFMTGLSLTLLQWFFEVLWEHYIKSRIRDAISREQSRISWMVRWGRGTRAVSVDQHKQGP